MSGDLVTDIKADTAEERASTSIQHLLNLTSLAAQRQDWLEVSNYLQELPRTPSVDKLFLLNQEAWDTAFNLAQEMLLKADFQHRWEIAKIMPCFGVGIISPLTALVKDETVEADTRWFICQILGNFPGQKTVVLTIVELLLQTTDEQLVEIAGKTLTKIGDRAIDALVDLAAKPQYRRLAVQSLFYIRTPNTIEPLLKFVQADEPELRFIAIKALGSFHDQRIAPVLITALQDTASIVRKEAAIALGFRADVCQSLNLISHLANLLADLNLEVVREAAIALGRMKQQEANLALFEVVQAGTTPLVLKQDLIKALGWSKVSSAVDYLRQALLNSSSPVQPTIITALGRIKTPELKLSSAQALLDFWQTIAPDTCSNQAKLALASALGELGCNCAQTTLKQLATDSDRKVKLYALGALKKLS